MQLPGVKSGRKLWVCLALATLTFVVYAPSLTHEFLTYDDQQYVTENPHVRAGLTWPGIVWAGTSFYASNWHPLTWLSHMLDCQLYGLHPAGHHLTNVLLHVANTLLLFQVLCLMTGALWRSALVAALFAWHPLHVESVAWIAERKDVLSAFFWMLTLWAYTAYVMRESRVEGRGSSAGTASALGPRPSPLHAPRSTLPYVLCLGFFSLGLMSKPMVVTLPFVMLLLDVWPLRRTSLWRETRGGNMSAEGAESPPLGHLFAEKIPFFLLSVVGCVLTLMAQQRGSSIVPTSQLPPGWRVINAIVAYCHYIGAMFIPRGLAIFYPYPLSRPAIQTAAALVFLVLISAFAFRWIRRRPYVLVGWFWYLGTLVPVIGLIQVGQQAWADRYTYLPLIGLFVILAWGFGELASHLGDPSPTPTRARLRVPTFAFAGIVLAAALLTTFFQQRYWRNTQTVFDHAARVAPNNFLALSILASLQVQANKPDEAMALCREALRYKPTYAPAHFFLGRGLEQKGEMRLAFGEYEEALRFEPRFSQAHIFLGLALARQNEFEAAAGHYLAALKIDPDSATAENNLARVLHSQGKHDEAIAHYSRALELDPSLAEAQNNLGVLLVQKGQLPEGVAHLRATLRLKPGDEEARYNLALALNQQGEGRKAVDLFQTLTPARAQDAAFHFHFAEALAQIGHTRDAMNHYAQALLLNPDFPEALDGLSWLLATSPKAEFRNGPEAVRMAERACELTGRMRPGMLATLAAAFAECARFEDAIKAAQQAQSLALQAEPAAVRKKCQEVLRAVQSTKPMRGEN